MIRSTGSNTFAEPRLHSRRTEPASAHLTWLQIARHGAATGTVSVIVYVLLFMVYAAIRYTAALWAAPPDAGVWSTWAVGLLSMFIAVLATSLIMLIPAVLVGVLTALIVAGLAGPLHTTQHPRRGVIVGIAVALAVVLLVHLPLFQARLLSWPGLTSPTYLFWLGLPSVVYGVVAAIQARRLQSSLAGG